ncbi:MAG: hypothetical protein K5668_10745 [Lachnospiraceae bacterium]|nr:hypothetical protein [Lachnospiraceae bacterium]
MKEKKSSGKIIAVIAVVVLVLVIGLIVLSRCSGDKEGKADKKTEAEFQNGTDIASKPGQKESIINGGKPYGDPDTTWTVMLYLCGTDLESRYGFASINLNEICNADLSDNVNVVIETGGAGSWQTSGIPTDKLSRYHMSDGEMYLDETCPSSSMGEAETLSDFISWSASEYPADRYMLVLWDHGGGSLFGICLDELYGSDSLSLKEVETAIVDAEVPFEVAGFDACLMSTLETAEVFQGYAHYMVASEEVEPGTGWDYIAWLNYLSRNTGCSGKELGQTIVDSYMSKCESIAQESMATLSVSDLTKLSGLSEAFRNYSGELVMSTQNVSDFQDVVQGAAQSESYGERSGTDGTYDMVDLGDLMNNTGGVLTEYSDDVLKALEDVVVYESHGIYRSRASGLSVFYPKYIDNDIYEAYEDITDNTAYLEYASIVNGDWDSDAWETAWSEAYDQYENEEESSGGFFDSLFSTGVSDEENEEEYEGEDEEEYDEEDDTESSGGFMNDFFGSAHSEESVSIFQNLHPVQAGDEELKYEQYIDEDNIVRLNITSGLDLVKDVRFRIVYVDDEGEALYLGCDRDINADYDTGEFSDNFRGTWMTIGGEYVCAELTDSTDDYDLYIIPARVNGEETFIRAVYEFEKEEFRVLGTYDGADEETNLSGRNIHPLEEGDKVDFIFYSFDMESDDDEDPEEVILGSIVWSDDTEMLDEETGDGKFYYLLEIEDIFGNETDCEPIVMEVKDGEITAYEQEEYLNQNP